MSAGRQKAIVTGRLGIHTQGKAASKCQSEEQQEEADEELAVLANGGKEWAARCSLPNLEQ